MFNIIHKIYIQKAKDEVDMGAYVQFVGNLIVKVTAATPVLTLNT